jgi:hypothetical protein
MHARAFSLPTLDLHYLSFLFHCFIFGTSLYIYIQKKEKNKTDQDVEQKKESKQVYQRLHCNSFGGEDDEVEIEECNPEYTTEDTGIMNIEELQFLEETHTNGEISNEQLTAILERYKRAMSDFRLNTYTCCVCDLFKKRHLFYKVNMQPTTKVNHVVKYMHQVLHFSAVDPPLPTGLVQEFVPLWEGRPHLDGLLLSINGFEKRDAPSDAKEKDMAYVCTMCYTALHREGKKTCGNPPKFALANHLCIGTCPLPQLTPMQHKMLALITTRSEVVVYRYVMNRSFLPRSVR